MKHFKTNMSTLLILHFLAFLGFCSVIAELSFHVLEEQKKHTFIGSVSASNKSESSRYLFSGPVKEKLFSINPDSGKIYTAKRIDREDICGSECVFTLKVRISSTTFEEVTVKIYIDDINDNAPWFQNNEVLLKIKENEPLDTIYPMEEALDFDIGNNSVMHYTLLNNENNRFSLIQKKGQLDGLKVNKALDYEKQTFYQLTIVAKDQGIPQRSGSKLINITVLDENDNTPKFEKVVYNQTIFENIPIPSIILKLHAVDKDSGVNGEVRYKLCHKTSPRIRKIFGVNESSGAVILKNSLGDKHHYSFGVIAYDQGPGSNSATASVTIGIVDVNDNSPVIDIIPRLVNVSEFKTLGFNVAAVYISDKDKGDNGKVNCSVANANQYFDLKQHYEETYEIVIMHQLDYEHITTYNITIKCEDNGIPQLKSENTLVVNVIDENDNPPIFNSNIKNVNIIENNKVPEIITKIIATDKDKGINSEIYYYLESSDKTSDFTLNNRTGVITTNKIFDRETVSVVEFRVFAVDCGIVPLTSTGTVQLKIIDVNDNIPLFQKQYYEFHILEAQAIGTTIGTVEAKDLDAEENGAITYEIEKDNIASELFIVIGDVLKTKAVLNRAKGQRYDFFIVASDHGQKPLSSSTNVTVIVEDANDNCPYIIYPSDTNNTISLIYEMTPTDQPISQIIAFDNDEGENARLSYFLKNTPETNNLFIINETSGEIMLIKDSNIKTLKQTYKLSIYVKDNGKPPKNTHTILIVHMKDGHPLKSTNNTIVVIVSLCTAFIILFIIGLICAVTRADKQKRQYFARKHENASLRKKNNFPNANEFNNNSGKSVALKSTSEGNDSQFLQGNGNSPEAADSSPPEIRTPTKECGNKAFKEPSFQYSNLLCKDDTNNLSAEANEESQITIEPEVDFPLDRSSIKGSCAALLDG